MVFSLKSVGAHSLPRTVDTASALVYTYTYTSRLLAHDPGVRVPERPHTPRARTRRGVNRVERSSGPNGFGERAGARGGAGGPDKTVSNLQPGATGCNYG